MHNAKLDKSERLQRVLKALRASGGGLSTRDIMVEADVCAVNSCIAELRENGFEIECRQQVQDGRRLFFYRLLKEPEGQRQSNGAPDGANIMEKMRDA